MVFLLLDYSDRPVSSNAHNNPSLSPTKFYIQCVHVDTNGYYGGVQSRSDADRRDNVGEASMGKAVRAPRLLHEVQTLYRTFS